jgi:hypothetical protein
LGTSRSFFGIGTTGEKIKDGVAITAEKFVNRHGGSPPYEKKYFKMSILTQQGAASPYVFPISPATLPVPAAVRALCPEAGEITGAPSHDRNTGLFVVKPLRRLGLQLHFYLIFACS